jgi:hypothetical protein
MSGRGWGFPQTYLRAGCNATGHASKILIKSRALKDFNGKEVKTERHDLFTNEGQEKKSGRSW